MTDEELVPCPFCGDDEELRVCQPEHMHGYWVVHCGCCGGEMQDESRGGAIAGWNERAPLASLQGQLGRKDAALRQSRDALQRMMDAWFDYHDSHSLTQPVTGAAGNAFDDALAARDAIDAIVQPPSGKEATDE